MPIKKPTGVCADCFYDYALQDFVKKNLAVEWCSFCKKKSREKIGADPQQVASYFLGCLWVDYDIPDNHLYYDFDGDEENGWLTGGLVHVYDGYDLVHEEFYDCFNNQDLVDYFSDFVSDYQFIRQNFERLDAKELYKYSWETFVQTVKHQRRFVLSQYRDESISEEEEREIVEPAHFVDFVLNFITQHSLVTEIPIGTALYRVRVHSGPLEATAKTLGTCPFERANYSNRMSPAGIPMFYAGLDRETALVESIDEEPDKVKGKYATIGTFKSLRSLRVVDFYKASGNTKPFR